MSRYLLFLFCVHFILRALHVLKSSRGLCPHVSSFVLVLWSPRSGKRELVCVLLVHLFVLYVLVFVIFLFLLVSGVGCGMWLGHSLDFSINFFSNLQGLSNMILVSGHSKLRTGNSDSQFEHTVPRQLALRSQESQLNIHSYTETVR